MEAKKMEEYIAYLVDEIGNSRSVLKKLWQRLKDGDYEETEKLSHYPLCLQWNYLKILQQLDLLVVDDESRAAIRRKIDNCTSAIYQHAEILKPCEDVLNHLLTGADECPLTVLCCNCGEKEDCFFHSSSAIHIQYRYELEYAFLTEFQFWQFLAKLAEIAKSIIGGKKNDC
jgi:hypothetical protein